MYPAILHAPRNGSRCMKIQRRLSRLIPFAATAIFAASAQAQSAAQGLGTLFFTPTERTDIVATRLSQQGIVTFDNSLSVTGLVKRGGVKSTVWVNGQALNEGQAVHSGLVPRIGPRSVAIDGQALRVGESLDVGSAGRADFIPPGTVSIRKQK